MKFSEFATSVTHRLPHKMDSTSSPVSTEEP